MAFPSADGGGGTGSGAGGTGAGGADSGGRGRARGHAGEGYSWTRPNPARPLRWFTRLAVYIRVRPNPNMRRFHTPVAYPIRPVKLSPLQIKRAEILQVKQQLDDLLKEARINLKTPAQYEPNISVTVQQPWTGVILKSGIAVAVFLASMKRLTAFQTFWKVGSNAVDIAMKYESENDLYARVVHEFSSKMKATIEYALENKEISAELAKELLNVVDKYDTTVSMILARNGSRFFSLNVLKAVLQLPQNVASLADKLRAYGSAFRFLNSFADAAYRVSQSVGDPGLFEDIGKEAIDITRDDFLLNKVQLDVMQKHSLTFGAEIVGENLIKKMMLNLRNSDLSMCLSASEVVPGQAAEPNGADVNLCNPNFAEFHVEKLFADNIKGKLHLSYPLRNSKGLSIMWKRKPSFSLSSFWGVKDLRLYNVESLGFGGKLLINDDISWINCSAGVSVSSPWCNLGLTFKQPGLFTATCTSRMGNTRTVLGGFISYSYKEDRTKFAAGVLHSVDSSLHLKSCIRDDKVLTGLISKTFGKCRVNLVADIDFKNLRRLPRAGLFFSFP